MISHKSPGSNCSKPAASTRSNGTTRVALYARFSTEEQNPRSIDDQFKRCTDHVQMLNLGQIEFTQFSDAATSGEHVHRPGIDRVRALIEKKGCDLIVAEDLSRFYRHSTRAMQFIEAAVDQDIRVIAINSHMDTSEGTRWRMGGHFASIKAEMDNEETRQRIRRAMQSRFETGHAVGHLRPGYIRIPTRPATEREPAKGPFRDERDEQWTPVINRAFEMCAAGDPAWRIAEYLTQAGLPKSARAMIPDWTSMNAIKLIRCPVYAGFERFRVRHNVKKFSTGKTVQLPNAPDNILQRQMPHLAHVSRNLWEKANAKLDERSKRQSPKQRSEQRQGKVPRDSRRSLSNIFVCGVCGSKMYCDGTHYFCSNSRPQTSLDRLTKPRCWSRCRPLKATVERQLGQAVIGALVDESRNFEVLVKRAQQLVEQHAMRSPAQVEAVQKEMRETEARIERLVEAVEMGGDMEDLTRRLHERRVERVRLQAEIDELSSRTRVSDLPTIADVQHLMDEVKVGFLDGFGRQAGAALERLIDGKIEAHPYRSFDSKKIRLRATFRLRLVRALPEEWLRLLDEVNSAEWTQALDAEAIDMQVDLFEKPLRFQHARAVYDRVIEGSTIASAAHELGLAETTANRAFQRGKAMVQQAIDDPYVRVLERPSDAPNWKQ